MFVTFGDLSTLSELLGLGFRAIGSGVKQLWQSEGGNRCGGFLLFSIPLPFLP